MIVLFLSGMVAMIMMRTLHRDFNRYNATEAAEDVEEETGWKLVHGDVYAAAPPRRRPGPHARAQGGRTGRSRLLPRTAAASALLCTCALHLCTCALHLCTCALHLCTGSALLCSHA